MSDSAPFRTCPWQPSSELLVPLSFAFRAERSLDLGHAKSSLPLRTRGRTGKSGTSVLGVPGSRRAPGAQPQPCLGAETSGPRDSSGRSAGVHLAKAGGSGGLPLKPDDAPTWSNAAYLIGETRGIWMRRLFRPARLYRHVGSGLLQEAPGTTAPFRYFACYPNDSTFHFHLGLALLEQGDKQTARAELKAALTDKPSDVVRRNIETALSKAG
jgi:hypothetical protein